MTAQEDPIDFGEEPVWCYNHGAGTEVQPADAPNSLAENRPADLDATEHD